MENIFNTIRNLSLDNKKIECIFLTRWDYNRILRLFPDSGFKSTSGETLFGIRVLVLPENKNHLGSFIKYH